MKLPLIAVLALVFALFLNAASKDQDSEKEKHRQLIEAALPKVPKPEKKHQILCFSKAYGFVHNSIPIGKTMLEVMGEKTGLFEVTYSDDIEIFQPESLKKFDAICFNNNSKIQDGVKDPELRKSIIDYVKNGGGVFAIHAATDGGWPEYVEMIGGIFISHPWNAGGTWGIANEDPTHPVVKTIHDGKNFELKDELYQYKDYHRKNQRVLLALDMNHEKNLTKKITREDQDYALAWLKDFGEGRVFVSALGHNREVFHNPEILKMWVEGFRFVLGEIDVPTKSIPKPESNLTKSAAR